MMLRISAFALVVTVLVGSIVVDAALSPSLRAKRQLPTKNSVVATPLGLANVPPGSSVEPADSPNPGILVNPSVVDTPAGLVGVPGGAKVVPGYQAAAPPQQNVYASQQAPTGGYPQSSRVVLIKNLPLDYTWQTVSDRVQQFGELESVEMASPGVARVRFVQLPSAERAKATLEGTIVDGRVIGTEFL